MRPQKDLLSELGLRQKAYAHGIRFEGPAPPREWPEEHKGHFKVIRAIQFLQYEEYKNDGNVPSRRKSECQKRVKSLRTQVRHLLNDGCPNEPSWRELEKPILERFDQPVICKDCYNDLTRLEYEADCYNLESQSKLSAKRRLRDVCRCRSKQAVEKTEDHDDEREPIFCSVLGESITHVPGDDLDSSRISMKPDRVIGLRAPAGIARSETHFPVKKRDSLLLPFLVIEAKKEKDAPGFRSILYQTAFPIRRFLKAQADSDIRGASSEPCLVWFFAYQGEQWRLHAGTLDQDKVIVYDLWQGTIQSQDGALQLLLIVDYIWSWARDVYRPGIREGIFRDVSPVSTDRFRHSVSLCPTTSSAPNSQHLDQMQLDGIVVESGDAQSSSHGGAMGFPDASSHAFLRWAVGQPSSPSWTRLGSIRHANIVQYEFRYYDCLVDDNSLPLILMADNDPSLPTALRYHGVTISAEQLGHIASRWPTSISSVPELAAGRALRVTFFFQTYCDKSSWQIKRVLTCIVWEVVSIATAKQCELKDLTMAILQVRNVRGRDSVWLALQTTGLILHPKAGTREFEWKSFAQARLPEKSFDTLKELTTGVRLGNIFLRRVARYSGLFWVEASQPQYKPPAWRQDTKTGESMLAFRSSSWSDLCPTFCLFVLSEIGDGTTSDLHRLLEEAVSMKNYYGEFGYRWSTKDKRVLSQWRSALALEKSITA